MTTYKQDAFDDIKKFLDAISAKDGFVATEVLEEVYGVVCFIVQPKTANELRVYIDPSQDCSDMKYFEGQTIWAMTRALDERFGGDERLDFFLKKFGGFETHVKPTIRRLGKILEEVYAQHVKVERARAGVAR